MTAHGHCAKIDSWKHATKKTQEWGRAKGAEKALCGETVVQKGVFGESVSSLPP